MQQCNTDRVSQALDGLDGHVTDGGSQTSNGGSHDSLDGHVALDRLGSQFGLERLKLRLDLGSILQQYSTLAFKSFRVPYEQGMKYVMQQNFICYAEKEFTSHVHGMRSWRLMSPDIVDPKGTPGAAV